MDVAEGLREDDVAVPPRSAVLDQLARYLDAGAPVMVLVAKLDRLKPFNHAHGVERGDQLLAAIGRRMIAVAGDIRCVGSLRNDVFMMLAEPSTLPALTQIDDIVAELTKPLSLAGVGHVPELRIGVAISEPERSDVDELLIEASAAMRAAVSSRVSVVLADDNIRAVAHLEAVIERDIEAAMADDLLAFGYQPVVTLHDGVIHGAEALLRWDHPEFGVLDPTIVLARIDALGLMDRFTEWSITRVARDWATVIRPGSGFEGMSVSVNVSEQQLSNPLCVPMMLRALSAHSLRPESVILELVESGPVGVGAAAAKSLQALADAGFLIVLDDFGTGFNALEYFLRFPIHGLKFDRSLISSMVTSSTARTIVSGVARIADELGVVTVAEGLETTDEIDACRQVPLTLGQGWQFGYPGTLDEFVQIARRSRLGVDPADLERTRLDQRPPTS